MTRRNRRKKAKQKPPRVPSVAERQAEVQRMLDLLSDPEVRVNFGDAEIVMREILIHSRALLEQFEAELKDALLWGEK